MLFNSIEFVIFFIVTTALFFALSHKYRWILLLIASCFFYMYYSPAFILILFFIIGVDFYAGILMERLTDSRRKVVFVSAILTHVLLLGFFKYFNFTIGNVNYLFNQSFPFLEIALPIGLSFHTFQAMSYLIEVYQGNQKPERHLGIYSLYILFYPQIVAGPIERPQNLLHQFYRRSTFNYDNVVVGLRLMLWGLIKKIVIADRLTLFSDPVFTHYQDYPSITILLGIIFFSFQIFCDFSGYSDIARGTAKVMGYELMINFNYPYHSRTISEFWNRWHISLSTWFKDYIYKPLGGNRVNKARAFFNILIVFFLSGLWHGAASTFVVWGVLNGCYLITAAITKSFRERLTSAIRLTSFPKLNRATDIFFVFVLISFSWIFFRASSVEHALAIVQRLGALPTDVVQLLQSGTIDMLNLPGGLQRTTLCLLLIAFLEISREIDARFNVNEHFRRLPTFVRWSTYFAGTFMIIFLGSFHNNSFIYFQF
jgi:alginate O-acetyltransferase complex protein AlgI